MPCPNLCPQRASLTLTSTDPHTFAGTALPPGCTVSARIFARGKDVTAKHMHIRNHNQTKNKEKNVSMRPKLFLFGALCILLSGSCTTPSANGHDGHDHETENHIHAAEDPATHDHDHETSEEAHASGEIVLPPDKALAAGVKTDTVRSGIFHQVIRTSGQVLPAQGGESCVVAPVSGLVTFNNKVTEGMAVTEGNTLLLLSAKNLAEGDPVMKARVAYETARKEYERMKALLPEKIVSEKDYQQALQAYETARISYEAIGGTQTDDGLAVRSPISGYVKNLMVKEGEYVTVGQQLATITQDRRLALRADVSERYYQALPSITSANFRTPYNDQVYELAALNGRLLSYAKAANDGNHYLPVTFEFDNRGTVVPGAFVEIFLLSTPKDNVIAIPRTALTEEQGSFYVYLQVDKECYRKQLVTTGADDGQRVQILSGLKPGQRFVSQGAYQVKLAGATSAIPAHTHEH